MRRKIFRTLLIGIGVAFLIVGGIKAYEWKLAYDLNEQNNEALSPDKASSVQQTNAPVGLPTELIIPKLGIDAHIQDVGLAKSGNIGVPQGASKWRDVAWYIYSPRPGEKGNSIIVGHVDNALGLKAVFYHLQDLSPGDTFQVRTADNKTLTFRVSSMANYAYNDAPIKEIVGPTSSIRLNLITCTGYWIQSAHSYSQRLVVYSELVSSS